MKKLTQDFVCDCCRSHEFRKFPEEITGDMHVVMCRGCGLISTFPGLSAEELSSFYNYTFTGDPGASAAEVEGLEQTEIISARAELELHTIPEIENWVSPKGKSWLEVRFRTGALLQYLVEQGAEVYGLDFFDSNVRSANMTLPAATLKLTTPHNLLVDFNTPMDIISGLSIHVLAHLPFPSSSLRRIWQLLKRGGLLLLDEKDVTQVSDGATTLPLSPPNPMAHYHHFTLKSARQLVAMNGFEILHADYFSRVSDLRHFLIVARKSERAGNCAPLYQECDEEAFETLVRLHTN